jgi:hypothetical protein
LAVQPAKPCRPHPPDKRNPLPQLANKLQQLQNLQKKASAMLQMLFFATFNLILRFFAGF